MSMSISSKFSQIKNNHVNAMVGKGITIVTASGNQGIDASNRSPGSAGQNINVGSHGYTELDCKKPVSGSSNYGKSVHIVAPGVKVLSASHCYTYGKSSQMKILSSNLSQ